jgi:hypothetical protein
MGDDLEECKSNIFPIEKLWTEKYPSSRFNHLSTTSASISPSNNGISKFTCTLKGVAWPLDEDASPVGIHRRICAKLSIISFLCHVRASSRNILKGSPAPSYLFSSPMGFCRLGMTDLATIDWFESQLLVPRSCRGHARRKINEEKTTLIPLIWI